MICVVSKNEKLAHALQEAFKGHAVECSFVKPTQKNHLEKVYTEGVVAAVVDDEVPGIPKEAWYDMLLSLGKRIPVVVLGTPPLMLGVRDRNIQTYDAMTWLEDPTEHDIISVLDSCGAIGIDHRKYNWHAISLYNPQIPLHKLQRYGSLSVLQINAQSFRKIAVDYGNEALNKVQNCFQQMLYNMWGAQGSFRTNDLLCRRSIHSNTFYIFLEQSRSTSSVPAPGVLERLADRILIKLHNTFWSELSVNPKNRLLPDCITSVPELSIGFATAIHNPCIDSLEVIEQLLDTAEQESRIQQKRMKDRLRELMQALIHMPGLLRPNFQAVFQLDKLTKKQVDEVHDKSSIRPIQHLLYGFESLIRVRPEAIDAAIDRAGLMFLEPKYLRPDVLFSLAHQAKVALELDQVCFALAIEHSQYLSGTLMVNILPRNLYAIDRLKHLFKHRKNIMFEVSESEAINNFDLMEKVSNHLRSLNMGIATDDFGRGYAGLERVIKTKPDLIKLDRALIQDIHLDKPKQSFVEGLVNSALMTGSKMVAEGVECWEEAELLKKMGVNFIQGFLLHRPQPVEAILKDLEKEDRLNLNSVA
jgi:EAL domain-containing protein (putative c-di-GMP-specific phosphodiesterase class I)